MKYPIVMFVGKAGAGKDTAAQMVRDLIPNSAAIALADPLKEFARNIFGFSHEQMYGASHLRSEVAQFKKNEWMYRDMSDFAADTGIPEADLIQWRNWLPNNPTGRHILQTLGTEIGRGWNPDVWIDLAIKRANQMCSTGTSLVTITDGRFRNEVLKVKQVGGVVVNIRNPDQSSSTDHSSETEQDTIPPFWFDYIVTNRQQDGLEALRSVVRDLANNMQDVARHSTRDYGY